METFPIRSQNNVNAGTNACNACSLDLGVLAYGIPYSSHLTASIDIKSGLQNRTRSYRDEVEVLSLLESEFLSIQNYRLSFQGSTAFRDRRPG